MKKSKHLNKSKQSKSPISVNIYMYHAKRNYNRW